MNTHTNNRKILDSDIKAIMSRYKLADTTKRIIETENLLPTSLLQRLQDSYPQHSEFLRTDKAIFTGKNNYAGIRGFREIIGVLSENGINISNIIEREFFIDVYRFLVTKYVLNTINWNDFENDSLFRLVFPQPGMIRSEDVKKYADAKTDIERKKVVEEYQKKTNPHDGNQKLNKPWLVNEEGQVEILEGAQHKYPPIVLILDKTTQSCYAFCTYCFRHAQVRGDEDMFVQREVAQIHRYLKQHKEVTDILITGGDAGFITKKRFVEYVEPILTDPELKHIKAVRLGSRALAFNPEMFLTEESNEILEYMKRITDHGVQVVWVAHISTPKDIMSPLTLAAIRRMKRYGISMRSQSPIMTSISLFKDKEGNIDIDKSAQNWIDLGNILGMMGVTFHSMYFARPTGEHHFYTAPLIAIHKIFSKVYRTLSSINRPSRYITMTSSAGKISLLGTTEIKGETVFVLKFNEARNMEWTEGVYIVKYDELQHTIEKLEPYEGNSHFFEQELEEIEDNLQKALKKELNKII